MSRRIEKAELISKLKTLPGLTDEERSSLIGLLRKHKKYGLVWEDKPEDAEKLMEQRLPVLKEVKSRALLNDVEAPNHILIEGDNLHALTALTYTHAGKIDVIYIDPPYNTGNKDFVYNDSFVDSEDSFRHSKWLSFMNKRLKIAKKLLSDTGVIFISIDDNEQANLKILCDDVFGYNSYVAQFIWKKKQGGGNDSKYVVIEHEYAIAYCRNPQMFGIGLDLMYKPNDNLYPFHDEKGDYGLVTLDKASIQFSQSLVYEIIDPDGNSYYPRIVNGKQSCWRWGRQKVQKQYKELVFKNGKVYTKYYRPKGVTPRSLLVDIVYGRTESGKDDLAAIFETVPFNYPKPVSLLKHFISIGSSNNSIILDFFAGSGTTLHATMQLNADDGGHRQCILVTNNENNICEEVTYERNKRVINGYITPRGTSIDGLHHNNLRYYKTEFVSRERTVRNMRALVSASTDLLCIKEDIYHEQSSLGHLPHNANIYRYFLENGRHFLVIYQEDFIPVIVEEIKHLHPKRPLKVYVFSPDRDPYADEFLEVEEYVELCALPAAIYDAYMQVLPRRRDKVIEVNEQQVVTEDDEWEV